MEQAVHSMLYVTLQQPRMLSIASAKLCPAARSAHLPHGVVRVCPPREAHQLVAAELGVVRGADGLAEQGQRPRAAGAVARLRLRLGADNQTDLRGSGAGGYTNELWGCDI